MNENIDLEKLQKLAITAKRTLKILFYIKKGLSVPEIIAKTGAERQLIHYYINTTLKK